MKPEQKLAKRLKEDGAPVGMVKMAETGCYGDFTSPLATPIMQLVIDAESNGLPAIKQEAMNGEFDG